MTKILSRERFDQAALFLKTQARPLERALFELWFEGASSKAVLNALACFQNADGGFGCALEPDMRAPQSSALATGIGLGLLH